MPLRRRVMSCTNYSDSPIVILGGAAHDDLVLGAGVGHFHRKLAARIDVNASPGSAAADARLAGRRQSLPTTHEPQRPHIDYAVANAQTNAIARWLPMEMGMRTTAVRSGTRDRLRARCHSLRAVTALGIHGGARELLAHWDARMHNGQPVVLVNERQT